jgi:tRNA(fMet)-specific endonuclease VapC
MNKFALDTNAYRALRDNHQKVASLVVNANSAALPIVVLGELYHGIEKGSRKNNNLLWLNDFLLSESTAILHVDEETARIFGEISAELAVIGKPIQQNDIWIAALCKQHRYPLITADKGFNNIKGLDVINF